MRLWEAINSRDCGRILTDAVEGVLGVEGEVPFAKLLEVQGLSENPELVKSCV